MAPHKEGQFSCRSDPEQDAIGIFTVRLTHGVERASGRLSGRGECLILDWGEPAEAPLAATRKTVKYFLSPPAQGLHQGPGFAPLPPSLRTLALRQLDAARETIWGTGPRFGGS